MDIIIAFAAIVGFWWFCFANYNNFKTDENFKESPLAFKLLIFLVGVGLLLASILLTWKAV